MLDPADPLPSAREFVARSYTRYVRDQMGHASIQITVDTYGHLVPGGNRAAVDRLDDETQPSAPPAQPDDVSEGAEWSQVVGGPPGDRTRDTLIKSQVLYH